MRRRGNREINIFSMSALDLFASALGAFILIAIIALPYYLKVEPVLKKLKIAENNITQLEIKNQILKNNVKECNENQKKCEGKLQEQQNKNIKLESKLKIAEKKNKGFEEKNKEYQKRLSKAFCVITLKWDTNKIQDIDLHITDYSGDEYWYGKQSYGGSSFLAVDSKNVSRGAEVWVDSNLQPGKYKIEYVYFYGTGGSVPITITVLTNSFTKKIDITTLPTPSKRKKILIANITVHSDKQSSIKFH